jgi:thiamine biosynthesis lipoprotein
VTAATNEVVMWSAPSMGGTLNVAISTSDYRRDRAAEAARRAGQRVNAWASRLTRFTDTSDLSRLNSSCAATHVVRPTLAATLSWARAASERTDGIVDPTLLDARLAAQTGTTAAPSAGTWRLLGNGRDAAVERAPNVRFDLDGIAKGWLADRATALLADWPGAVVDADGDIALTADPDVEWLVAVADPRDATAAPLATLRLTGGKTWSRSYGVATSGTSVHRWQLADGRQTHHLIDPRTGHAAETDVVQATVVAPSAREAEVIAKTAVILGSTDALAYLDRSAALACLLLLQDGSVACLPGIDAWLA